MIREALNDGVDALAVHDILMEMTGHMGMKIPRVNPEKVLRQVAHILQDGKAWVYDEKGKFRGILAVVPDTPWWSDVPHLIDTAWYVAPEVRSKRVAFHLLDAAEAYAKMRQLPLYIGLFTGRDLFRKELLLARRGYHKIGSTMVLVK